MLSQKELCDNFVGVLQKIKITMNEMIDAADFKYTAIKEINLSEIIEANDRELLLLHQIEDLEKKRQDILETLSIQLGFDSSITISVLIQQFSLSFSPEIVNISKEIKNILVRLKISTERNSHILAANADIISHILDVVGRSQSDQYNNFGSSRDSSSMFHVLDQIV